MVVAFSLVAEPLKTTGHTLQNTRVDDATFSEVLVLFRAIFAPKQTIGLSTSVCPPICMVNLSGTGLGAKGQILLCETLKSLKPRKGFALELDMSNVSMAL